MRIIYWSSDVCSSDRPVICIAPELPIIVAGKLILIQPHRPPNGLAHLGPVGIGKERSGQPKNLRPIDPPSQLNAIDDIAPLVRTAHLKATGCADRKSTRLNSSH